MDTISSREFAQPGSCTPLAEGEEGGSPSVEHDLSQTVGATNTPFRSKLTVPGEKRGLGREGSRRVQIRKHELSPDLPIRAQHAVPATQTQSGSASWVSCF